MVVFRGSNVEGAAYAVKTRDPKELEASLMTWKVGKTYWHIV